MNNVDHGAAVFQKGLEKVVVIGVPVGVLRVVVDPYAVDKPQGLLASRFPLCVVFIEGVVEIIMQE